MTIRSPTFPARYMRLIAACIERRLMLEGGAEGDLGSSLHALKARDAPVALADVESVLAAVEQHLGDWPVGFEVGLAIGFQSHETLGLAIARCETCDQALRMISRYFDLITPSFAMKYERAGETARVAYRPLTAMTPKVLRMINEVHVVSFHMLLKALLGGRVAAYDIAFHSEPPRHAARYEALAPARVHFAALPLPEVQIALPAALLDAPLAGADPGGLKRARSSLGQTQSDQGEHGRWSDWVRLILEEAEEAQPSLEQLAGLLNVTSRTLARALEREGCKFRDLSTAVRHERACRWLAAGDKTVSEIAYRLGYTDVANFSHAFRRISGASPRAYARSARDGAA